MKAAVEIFLDKRPRKDGTQNVKIKVTYNRVRKYFGTDVNLSPEDFGKVMKGKRLTQPQKALKIKLEAYETKAKHIIDDLPIFTFSKFKEAFLQSRNINKSVSYGFDQYIELLISKNRLGTAESYTYAKKSLESFKKGLAFADITPDLLERYESWMLNNGKSISSVGIYLRSLRTIYNKQSGLDASLYPFGKGRYTIPASENIKKALTLEEVGRIFSYDAKPNSYEEMARDYWIFLYLCNGINVKDFCYLKWENIDGTMLTYVREKTKNTNRKEKKIRIALKPETMHIIKKWGIPSVRKESYIFPHLKVGMEPEEAKKTYKQLTRVINDNMKRIARSVGIEKEVTTYYARHSFATILKRSGANISMISEMLGHNDIRTTESYLDGFEEKELQEQTDVLTGFNKAN